MYAIVDIETTGGAYNQERMTEIAIYRYDGHAIVDRFESLVNPEKKIQNFVVRLTGITDKMVKKAPKFHEVAKRIVEITDGCTLVAHNADFDYRILHNEFKSLGYDYTKNSLCTVQLSQELIPDLPSYSLGKLCKSLGIPMTNRHRADGDAFATVSLFELLLQKDIEREIISKRLINPAVLQKKEKLTDAIASVPTSVGVFYIHQENGRIMYIGKASNMQKKLRLFLTKKSKKWKTIQSKLASVSYDETGNDTLGGLVFNQKINNYKPRYNSNYHKAPKEIKFVHDNMLIIYEGRHTSERAVIYIKDNTLEGYAYTDLEYQYNNIEILQNKLTPVENSLDNRHIVQTSLLKKTPHKIIVL